MGKVIVSGVILRNHRDEILVDEGAQPEKEIRSLTLDMIADSGSLTVGLPKSLIEKLGLPFLKHAAATLADGSQRKVEVYEDLTVMVDDRVARTQCIAKPENAPMLLGQLVLEQIDYVVDCRNQRIIPNPEAPPGVMLYDDF